MILFPVSAQTSDETTLHLGEVWAEQKDNTPNEWWIFVTILIDENYWNNLGQYSLKVNIGEQLVDMIPDLAYQKSDSNEQAFVGSFSDLTPATYQVSIQWNDNIISKVWIDETIQLGSSENQDYLEQLHEVGPGIALLTILALTVIFPGQKKIFNHSTKTKSEEQQERFQ
jgi:hypothetical protein